MPMRPTHWGLQGDNPQSIEELVKPLLGPEVTFEINFKPPGRRYCWSNNNIACQNRTEFNITVKSATGLTSVHAACKHHVRGVIQYYQHSGFAIILIDYMTMHVYSFVHPKMYNREIIEFSQIQNWLEYLERNT